MSPTDRVRRPGRRRRALNVERLEARGLMSVVPIYMGHSASHAAQSQSVHSPAGGAGGGGETLSVMGQPTPHELLRQRFTAKASGSFVSGPGRFTDQSLQGSIEATGGSSDSLHIDLRMQFFVPNDPTQPVTGVAALIPRNVSTTGSTLILDLTALPRGGSTALPGHFTWTVDGSSGGLYTSAGGFGTGQGTLDVHYGALRNGRGRAFEMGRASVVVQGLVNAGGIFSDVGGPGNSPRNP